MTNTFKTYHPVVNFGFFTAVVIFTMFFMNPFFLMVSFAASFLYSVSAPVAELHDNWFRYEKALPDVMKGASLKLYAGQKMHLCHFSPATVSIRQPPTEFPGTVTCGEVIARCVSDSNLSASK